MATIIQDNDKLELVLEKFYNRYNKFNSKVLEMLGETISKFEGLSPSNAHILAQELKLGYDLDYLMEELSRISGKSIQDINKLFDEVAKENVNFSEAYFKAKNKEFINYEDNQRLQNIVETIKKETNNTFKNLSKSKNIGFTLKDNEGNITYKPISKIYNELIDEAVYNTSLGIKNYQSSMTNVIRQLADSGVKIHEEKVGYKNGYNRRIDSSVRQNVLTGMRRINIGIQEEIGDMLGTDGVEISAHFPCAEDHLDIQGRQYSNKEFEELNSSLDRPIGEYNCTHFIFSIILGVNEPSYSKNMLSRYKRYSLWS